MDKKPFSSKKPKGGKQGNRGIKNAAFISLLVLTALIFIAAFGQSSGLKSVSTSEALRQANNGEYSYIEKKGNELVITKKGDDKPTLKSYIDENSSLKEEGFNTSKFKYDNAAASSGGSFWGNFLITFLPFIFLGAIVWFMLKSAQGQGNQALSFGKSRARLYGNEKDKVLFNDVAGQAEAKQDLEEVVEFLKFPKKFAGVGARIPKGVLLVGPPGTGKTMLARAVAGEANVPFFSISGSEFVEMFVGVGASRVRDLFAKAKKNAPCIIFIDEIDAVGRRRGSGMGGGHDEREQTLNQILVEMDGFEQGQNVIVLAATNRADVLDPALLRPGRFDRRVGIGLPDRQDREAILKLHFSKKPLNKSVDLDALAAKTAGSSGADLAILPMKLLSSPPATIITEITNHDVTEAFERVAIGPERKNKIMSEVGQGDYRLSRGRPRAGWTCPAGQRSGSQGDDHSTRRYRWCHVVPAARR